MYQLINTLGFAFRSLFAIYINRNLVTSRQGQVQGQSHNGGYQDTIVSFFRRFTDSKMQEGHTLSGRTREPPVLPYTPPAAERSWPHHQRVITRAASAASQHFPAPAKEFEHSRMLLN